MTDFGSSNNNLHKLDPLKIIYLGSLGSICHFKINKIYFTSFLLALNSFISNTT